MRAVGLCSVRCGGRAIKISLMVVVFVMGISHSLPAASATSTVLPWPGRQQGDAGRKFYNFLRATAAAREAGGWPLIHIESKPDPAKQSQ